MVRGVVTILGLVVVLAGCGGAALVPADGAAGGPCASVDLAGPEPPVHCRRAIELADERLGWMHWPVTSVEYRTSMCPPNARCAFVQAADAWVIYTFSDGSRSMVHVGLATVGDAGTDELIADEPEPVPDWLLEEMNAPGAA